MAHPLNVDRLSRFSTVLRSVWLVAVGSSAASNTLPTRLFTLSGAGIERVEDGKTKVFSASVAFPRSFRSASDRKRARSMSAVSTGSGIVQVLIPDFTKSSDCNPGFASLTRTSLPPTDSVGTSASRSRSFHRTNPASPRRRPIAAVRLRRSASPLSRVLLSS